MTFLILTWILNGATPKVDYIPMSDMKTCGQVLEYAKTRTIETAPFTLNTNVKTVPYQAECKEFK